MGVLLPSERKTRKGRFFLAFVYSLLTLGGLTMVYPFLVMIAASFSGPYDYHRHSPMVRALWDDSDRFMRSISSYFPRFPREVFPDAPASWGTWLSVARDTEGVRRFAESWLEPARTNEAVYSNGSGAPRRSATARSRTTWTTPHAPTTRATSPPSSVRRRP